MPTAKDIVREYPKYNILTNNCQHFARRLVNAIRDDLDERAVESDGPAEEPTGLEPQTTEVGSQIAAVDGLLKSQGWLDSNGFGGKDHRAAVVRDSEDTEPHMIEE